MGAPSMVNGNGDHLIGPDGTPVIIDGVPVVFRAASSDILDRYRFARAHGLTFNGARDVYKVLGYNEILTNRDYWTRYRRGGIAKRIVDVYAHATWRAEMELIEDENPDVITPFEQAWLDLDAKHQLQARLLRADKLSGLSTYSVLVIGAPGLSDTELPKAKDASTLLYFRPALGGGGGVLGNRSSSTGIDATASIDEWDTDPQSPRFGLPKSYRIKVAEGVPALTDARAVHWSRVLHIAENCLEDDVFGTPALEAVWNLLDDLDKVTGGGAESFWNRANQGMHIDIDKDMSLGDATAEKAALAEQAELYKHQIQRWIRTRGVTVDTLGSDVANFQGPADAIITQIAGTKGIPKRILTGSEMGELASSQDRENWRDQIVGRQKGFAAPYIIRPLVERLITYGYLPEPKKGIRGYEVKWPNIEILTEAERMAGALSWAGTTSPGEGPVFTNAENRDKWYGKKPLDDAEQAKIKPVAPVVAGTDAIDNEDDGEDTAEDGAKKFPRAAGGRGSGNFGHAGRPGQIGGSGVGGVFYHGTAEDVLASIRTEGLKPAGSAGSEISLNEKYDADLLVTIAGREAAVHITSNLDVAAEYASLVGENRNAEAIILRIEIPDGTPAEKDEIDVTAFRLKSIPSKWITGWARISEDFEESDFEEADSDSSSQGFKATKWRTLSFNHVFYAVIRLAKSAFIEDEAEMTRVLEDAITSNNVEVIDRILGLERTHVTS